MSESRRTRSHYCVRSRSYNHASVKVDNSCTISSTNGCGRKFHRKYSTYYQRMYQILPNYNSIVILTLTTHTYFCSSHKLRKTFPLFTVFQNVSEETRYLGDTLEKTEASHLILGESYYNLVCSRSFNSKDI